MKISEKKASELTGLPRSTIQRFRDIPGEIKILNPKKEEKTGLFETVTFYYYDEVEMEKLWLIKLFKSLGKTKTEIIKEMTNSNFDKKKFLENTIKELTELIKVAEGYLNTGIGYEVLDIMGCDEMSYKEVNLLNNISNDFFIMNKEKIENLDYEFSEEFGNLIVKIYELFEKKVKYNSDEIQNAITQFKKIYFDDKYKSNGILLLFLHQYSLDESIEENDINVIQYFEKALKYNERKYESDNLMELDISQFDQKFYKLAYEQFKSNSKEIQEEIHNLALYYYYLYFKSWKFTFDFLSLMSEWYDKDEIKQKYDNGNEKGIYHFLSVAIKTYINLNKGGINE